MLGKGATLQTGTALRGLLRPAVEPTSLLSRGLWLARRPGLPIACDEEDRASNRAKPWKRCPIRHLACDARLACADEFPVDLRLATVGKRLEVTGRHVH